MDYNLCLSSSSRLCERSLLCYHTSSNAILKRSTSAFKPNLCLTQVSPEDTIASGSNSENFSLPMSTWTSPPSKSVIWVNPHSEKASQILQKRRDPRYNPLVKLSNSLDSCQPTLEGVSTILNSILDNIIEQDAITILNYMSSPITAQIVLNVFIERLKPTRMVIYYNVTMKVFRKCKEFGLAEKLFDEMLLRGVKPDNATFSTIISCARLCSLPDKALEWCNKMPTYGCHPDAITYSTIIESYGQAGNVDMAITLFDRARKGGLDVSPITLAMLIKFHGLSGYVSKCMRVYEGMKALGIKLNLLTYNNMLLAVGRAKKPWLVGMICRDMAEDGVEPSRDTYIALLQIYCRARYVHNVLHVYKVMKEKSMDLNVGLFNTVLSVCADLGFVSEAVEIFHDMCVKSSIKPDIWTFCAMITVYSHTGNVSETEALFNQMVESGIEPNILILTSLIQCYGKARCIDKVLTTFNRAVDLGITLDEQLFCSLLIVIAQSPKEDMNKLITGLGKANPELTEFLALLVDEKSLMGAIEMEVCKVLDAINPLMKKSYLNYFIDTCSNLNMPDRARNLLNFGLKAGIYNHIESKTSLQWSLHLKTFSPRAAVIVLDSWINRLLNSLNNGEEFPAVLGIHTGHGKLAVSALANAIKSRLEQLDAPFCDDPEKVGWFMTSGTEIVAWLVPKGSPELPALSL